MLMNQMVYISRTEYFCAAHKLYRPDWPEEKNQEVYGKCSNPNWHGHNYELTVTVKGKPVAETGFVMDLRALSDLIKLKIISKLDHKNVNLDCDFMQGKMASTEVLAVAIWDELFSHLNSGNVQLHCVCLQETQKNKVEYFG